MHNSHRRLLLQAIAASWMLSVSKIGFATSVQIVAIRVWPALTYTRITLESNLPLKYRQFTLSKPDRIVVDIEDIHLNEVLREMTRQVQATDPHLKQVRFCGRPLSNSRLILRQKMIRYSLCSRIIIKAI